MRSPWLWRIYNFFRGPHPLQLSLCNGRLSPVTFRRFSPADLIDCLEIYALNEKDRFPRGVRDLYRKTLLEQSAYTLVGEKDGRIVASGGIAYWMRDNVAVLSFGLVHPDYQGQGIGTALLLSRLSLLDPKRLSYGVLIFALAKSIGFYRRFGFRPYDAWQDQHGDKHPSGYLLWSSGGILRCRKLLAEKGISVPADQDKVPMQPLSCWDAAESSAKPPLCC